MSKEDVVNAHLYSINNKLVNYFVNVIVNHRQEFVNTNRLNIYYFFQSVIQYNVFIYNLYCNLLKMVV